MNAPAEQLTAPGQRGLLARNRWLLARRSTQLGILALFLAGPWFGVWWLKGNLASSTFLDVIGLTDPLVLPAETTVTTALYRMRRSHQAMAVVSRNKKHVGIVTIKDLVEEIVGELEAW